MKTLGYILITVGFLTGALASVQTSENEVTLNWFLPALAAGVAGVALARIGAHREASHADTLQVGFESLSSSMDRIVELITELDAEKAQLDPYDVHGRIDALLPDHLNTFAEGRESIIHLHGMKAYAQIMNDFAAGERYLNRVWSASIDGYIDEVQLYIGRSKEQFEAARRKLAELPSPTSAA